MKVLVVTTAYPTPRRPVFGTFVREHARAAATRADVTVLHLDRSAPQRGVFEVRHVEDEPVPTLRVSYRRFGPPVSYLALAAGAFAALRRIQRPDVVHAHGFHAALAALVLGHALRVPVVYTEHWTIFLPEDRNELTPTMRRLAALALRRSDLVLPVSESLRAALAALAPEARFCVVGNAVDTDLFHPPATEAAEQRLLTVVSMDDESKGVDVLLDAVSRLPRVRLDVVGDGVLRGRYEELAAQLGVANRVTFHGRQTKPAIAELLRSARVFVLASRWENNPVVVLEALCTGLPVVATTVGGVPEIVDRVVAPDDPSSLAQAVQAALAELVDRDAIAAAARERFGLATIGRELRLVYDDVTRGAGS